MSLFQTNPRNSKNATLDFEMEVSESAGSAFIPTTGEENAGGGQSQPRQAGGFSEAREREGERRNGTTVPVVERSLGEAAAVTARLARRVRVVGWRWDVASFGANAPSSQLVGVIGFEPATYRLRRSLFWPRNA
jgi:hypothetical protein